MRSYECPICAGPKLTIEDECASCRAPIAYTKTSRIECEGEIKGNARASEENAALKNQIGREDLLREMLMRSQAREEGLREALEDCANAAENFIDTFNEHLGLIPDRHFERMDGIRGALELSGDSIERARKALAAHGGGEKDE